MTTWNKPTEVKLLSGGNPQIPKGDGDEPVQAYIEAMPGWKRALGERIDEDQLSTWFEQGSHLPGEQL